MERLTDRRGEALENSGLTGEDFNFTLNNKGVKDETG